MRALLPTLKERKRYLVYELVSEKALSRKAEQDVLQHLERTLGLFDGARAGILSVKYDEKRQVGVLRMSHTSVDKVKTALLLLQEAGGSPVIPHALGVSGILQKTERFFPEKRTKIAPIQPINEVDTTCNRCKQKQGF